MIIKQFHICILHLSQKLISEIRSNESIEHIQVIGSRGFSQIMFCTHISVKCHVNCRMTTYIVINPSIWALINSCSFSRSVKDLWNIHNNVFHRDSHMYICTSHLIFFGFRPFEELVLCCPSSALLLLSPLLSSFSERKVVVHFSCLFLLYYIKDLDLQLQLVILSYDAQLRIS